MCSIERNGPAWGWNERKPVDEGHAANDFEKKVRTAQSALEKDSAVLVGPGSAGDPGREVGQRHATSTNEAEAWKDARWPVEKARGRPVSTGHAPSGGEGSWSGRPRIAGPCELIRDEGVTPYEGGIRRLGGFINLGATSWELPSAADCEGPVG